MKAEVPSGKQGTFISLEDYEQTSQVEAAPSFVTQEIHMTDTPCSMHAENQVCSSIISHMCCRR
jgi:hypothetical protein